MYSITKLNYNEYNVLCIVFMEKFSSFNGDEIISNMKNFPCFKIIIYELFNRNYLEI